VSGSTGHLDSWMHTCRNLGPAAGGTPPHTNVKVANRFAQTDIPGRHETRNYESRLQSSESRISISSTFIPVVQTYQLCCVLQVQKLTESNCVIPNFLESRFVIPNCMSPGIGCKTIRGKTISDGMSRNPMSISVQTYSHQPPVSFKAFGFCEKAHLDKII
jgi:hypothetical protein